ncbi:hypothetical protein GCM10022405_11450 [Gibbsiella dentisursi]|uniref:Uncharacterized protein n=1 Tax=Gibbsiella dentisursi TaxID=796890 RepID=A0ABP7KXN0_9GAMM
MCITAMRVTAMGMPTAMLFKRDSALHLRFRKMMGKNKGDGAGHNASYHPPE